MIVKAQVHREVVKRSFFLGALNEEKAVLVSADYSPISGMLSLFFEVDDGDDAIVELPARMP